jgi:Recombinase zinc beta ribbon domain
VDLSEAGLSRAQVDAARERISRNRRRPPSTVAQRFWELSGGMARCAVCDSALSPHTSRRPKKTDCYYRCTQRYNSGPRDCTHTRMHRADAMEEAVWQGVFSVICDGERLKRQHREHIDRKLRRLRGDPDREARSLAEKLRKLDQKEDYLLDLAADTSMPKERLGAKLAEADAQRTEFRKALRETQDRQQTIKRLEWERDHNLHLVEGLGAGRFVTASPRDRRRIYQALQLRAEVDEDGTIRLSGVFDPDVHLHAMVQDPPVDPSKPIPQVPDSTDVVVTLDNTPSATS